MPNRIIKESIKRSPQIDSLTWFEEVVFYRLIVTADDYGCCDGRPILLRNELFPTKETVTKKAIEDAISKLASVGLLYKYTVSGMPYLFFPTWEKHQRVRNKRRKFPEPPRELLSASCCQMTASCLPESESNPNPESESNPNGDVVVVDSAHARDAELSRAISYYAQHINATFGRMEGEEITAYTQKFGADIVIRAIDAALSANGRTWTYIRGILRNWERKGVKTLADVQQLDAEFEAKKQSKADNTSSKKMPWQQDNPFIAIAMEAYKEEHKND